MGKSEIRKRLLIGFCFSLVCISAAFSSNPDNIRQHTDNTNAWFMYFSSFRISNKIGLYAEAQLRRANKLKSPQQLLLRTGINYYFNSSLLFTAGYCFVETHPYGEFPAKSKYPENRFWEQFQIKTGLNRVEWISRLRLEQRLSKLPVAAPDFVTYEPGASVYTNRIRLMNRFSFPFIGKEIKNRSLYLSIYDELFINFGKNVGLNYLDQNRAYIALGYVIPKIGRLELGYMEQTIIKSDAIKIEDNHTLQIALTTNLDFRKKE